MAIKTYTKGTATQLSKNFKSTEFDCHGKDCCLTTKVDEDLVKILQDIRDHFGKPVNVSSAYRCETHNANVGGATGSRHKKGQAADIYINGIAPAEIAKYAESKGVLGIGLYETDKDGHFVHIDTRTSKSFWYGQAQEKRTTFGGTVAQTVSKIELPKDGVNGKMKYNENNKPLVCMQTQSTCYKGTGPMTVKGVLWHSTGANNPTLKRYVQPDDNATDREAWLELLGKNQYNNDWNHIERQAGLNCWIGKLADGTVTTIQTMPWDYKPWGCGSGSKGSCNSGWIQFEICEDGLTDKEYFTKAYNEACEITAYLCKMYNIDPHGTVEYKGVNVPTILCHYDSHKLGLGSNHGDIDHWFPKFGKSMQTARDDVAKLMGEETKKEEPVVTPPVVETPVVTPEPAPKEDTHKKGDEVKLVAGATYISGQAIPSWVFEKKLYVREIRSNGDIVFSTLATGAVTGVTAAENLAPYNSGTIVEIPKEEFKLGDEVKLRSKATYSDGKAIPKWVFSKKLYVRSAVRANGDIVISTLPTGAVTGVVNKSNLLHYDAFEDYKVQVTASVLNVREKPTTANSAIVAQTKKGDIHTVTEVKGDWGHIASGWIFLPYTKKA